MNEKKNNLQSIMCQNNKLNALKFIFSIALNLNS